MKRALVAFLSLAVSSAGCSIVFVEKPHVTAGKVECTSSYKFPLIDGAVGVAGIATPFILEAMRNRQTTNPNIPLDIAMWATGLAAAISAVVGITRVGHCRDLETSMALTAPTTPPPAMQPTGPDAPPVAPPPPQP